MHFADCIYIYMYTIEYIVGKIYANHYRSLLVLPVDTRILLFYRMRTH